MKTFLITFWLQESSMRERLGGLGQWPGAHQMVVKAKNMRAALNKYAHPADDCYKIEIVPIHYERGLDK